MDLEYVDLKLEDLLEYIQKNNTNENHTYYYNKIVELKKDINEDKIDNNIYVLLKELGAYLDRIKFKDLELAHVMCELMMIRAVTTFRG